MNSLKVTYYIENDQKTVKPYIDEEFGMGQQYFELKQILSRIKNNGLSENLNKMWENLLSINHYVNLIQKGHSYEEILTLLQQQIIEKENNHSRVNTIIGLLQEKDYLNLAVQKDQLWEQYLFILEQTNKENPEFYREISDETIKQAKLKYQVLAKNITRRK